MMITFGPLLNLVSFIVLVQILSIYMQNENSRLCIRWVFRRLSDTHLLLMFGMSNEYGNLCSGINLNWTIDDCSVYRIKKCVLVLILCE